MRTSVDDSTASKCMTGTYTSNYNVTFYDMDYNNNIYIEEYAVKITHQPLIGLSPLTLSIPTSLSSSATITTLSSLSPTTLCIDCDNSKLFLIIIITIIVINTINNRICTRRSTGDNNRYV